MIKNISILGSTGSIGVSTVDLVLRHPDQFRVLGLCAGSNLTVLADQIKKLNPLVVSVKSKKEADDLSKIIGSSKTEILFGEQGAISVATISDVTTVVSAIVGAAGLMPTLAAIRAGKEISLANKESMVIAGEIMNREAKVSGSKIIPVDSEHSALFQCLEGRHPDDVAFLILTASGGPFFKKPADEFASITVAEALKHPNWSMGKKITIDSATMMNKGLEVMEAHWLFDMPMNKIQVVIHPQSIVHSMVELIDGSVLAHMGVPDMRVPIAYALSRPRRVKTGVSSLNLFKQRELTFFEPDFVKFPCLKLAFEVSEKGGTYPAVLNAANEVAVDAFLSEKIPFVKISQVVSETLDAHESSKADSLENVVEADRWAREKTGSKV